MVVIVITVVVIVIANVVVVDIVVIIAVVSDLDFNFFRSSIHFLFKCVLASLYEVASVRPSVRWMVGQSDGWSDGP